MQFFLDCPQPSKRFHVRGCGRDEWQIFRRYHYLNTDLNSASQCWGLYDDSDNIIGFCAIIHFPHPSNPKIKKCHRIVILPDYQGIGLGYKFLNIVAEHYHSKGYDFTIVTSAKNFVYKLHSSDKWAMIRLSKTRKVTGTLNLDSSRRNSKTASFRYIGERQCQ